VTSSVVASVARYRWAVALVTSDVTWSMPPLAHWYSGADAVVDFANVVPMRLCPGWRYRLTTANGQPAVGFYLRNPETEEYTGFSLTVLTMRGDRIADLTSFIDPELFGLFGMPVQVDP
jgi:RNA polymerase sigma-70 factor (ECF subfamily)